MKRKFKLNLIAYYKNLSIKYRLLLLFCIQIIIPLCFISYMNFQKSSEIVKTKSSLYSQDILKMIELRMDDLYENINTLSMDLLYDNNIYDNLNNHPDNNSDYNQRAIIINDKLRKSALSRNEIQSIALVSNNRNFYTFDINSSKADIEAKMPYETLLRRARLGNGKLVWYVDKQQDSTNVYVVRQINNRDNFTEIGLMVILLKNESLEDTYSNISKNDIQNIALVSNDGIVVVSSQDKLDFNNTNTKSESFIDKKKNILISYRNIENTNWKIVTNISLNILYSEINSLRRWMYLWLIAALLMSSLLTILTSFDIIDPINKLVEGMKNVEKGVKHKPIILNRNDELGYLSKTFNAMSEKIDYLVNRIYGEEITRKEAELKALQAQINPHFLFNTLEIINWLAQLNGVPEISKIVSSLASLMDASIGRDDKLITLNEEFKYIKNYISIIKIRYEDRLDFSIDAEVDTLDIKIPRLLIQPIVENSVYHGIDKITSTGKIEIKSYKNNNTIIIEVKDNGIGIKRENLIILNERFLETNNNFITKNKAKSIGLENVNKRIKLFYGENFGLKIESSYGIYTKVTITIPTILPSGAFS